MVAKEVIIKTNSYQNDQPGWMWISDGSGKFKISPLENFKQGTEIKLMLKDDAVEFADKTRIEEVIKKYSNFVPYPIKLEEEKVNTISAIWTQTPSSVKEEEYREFYKFMANSVEDPFFWVHKAADVPLQIYSILYVPKTSMENFGFGKVNRGLSLYARKVMIMSECKDLLPEYLRFVNGVVDSEDISLNISRETVQDNLVLQKIKRNLVKWIIDRISLVAAKEEENYHLFWQQFGRFIKEGIVADFDNRNKLAALLRFNTSLAKDQDETISLAKYLERMKEGQDEIYYMGGPNREEALASPLMEIFKEKGVEVLFLYDPMDEVLITHLKEFEGKQFKSVELGDLNLKALGVEEKTDKQEKPVLQQSKIDKILELFKELLKDQVSDVRESQRLTGSPCILVSPDDAVSSHVQKLMRQVNKDFPLSKRVLEINSDNKLISKLADLHYAGEKEEYVRNACLQLFDNLLVLEGMLQNPRQMVERVNYLMQESLGEEKSPIILT